MPSPLRYPYSADGQLQCRLRAKAEMYRMRREASKPRLARKLLCASPAVHNARSAVGQTTTKRLNEPARCPDRPLGKWRYMVTVTWYGHKAGKPSIEESQREQKDCRSENLSWLPWQPVAGSHPNVPRVCRDPHNCAGPSNQASLPIVLLINGLAPGRQPTKVCEGSPA